MNRLFLFIVLGFLLGVNGCRKPVPLSEKVKIRIDRVYSDQFPDKYYPEGECFMGFLFLDITIENHSDRVVRIFMREYPELDFKHPSKLSGAYGIYRGDTLELEAPFIINIPPHSFETRQFLYGNGFLTELQNKGNYSSVANFMRSVLRESRFYFIINERDTCILEPSSALTIDFLGQPNLAGEWIDIHPLRQGKLEDEK